MSPRWTRFATVDPFDGMTGASPGEARNLIAGHWASARHACTHDRCAAKSLVQPERRSAGRGDWNTGGDHLDVEYPPGNRS